MTNRTVARVFQLVLERYEQEPMTGGYADSLYLVWFDGGLSGRSIGMSEATFNRGLRELVDKGFLYPRLPGVYWTNPNLFFQRGPGGFHPRIPPSSSPPKDRTRRAGSTRPATPRCLSRLSRDGSHVFELAWLEA